MTSVPGLGKLVDDYDGNPATLRWLSIHPDGRVVDRHSDNRIAWSVEHELWVQWRLVRDVPRGRADQPRLQPLGGRNDPHRARGGDHRSGQFRADQPGRHGRARRAGHRLRGTRHGGVVGRGGPETGLHGDLDDERRAALRVLAERTNRTDPHTQQQPEEDQGGPGERA